MTQARVFNVAPPWDIQFFIFDPWAYPGIDPLSGFLGSERPTFWEAQNWLDAYPYIYVDGGYYYYP